MIEPVRMSSAGVALALAVMLNGCRSQQAPPPPYQAPAVTLDSTHYYGTPLSGPLQTPTSAAGAPADQTLLENGVAPTGAVDARVQIISLERNPGQVMQSLGGAAQLIIAARGSEPVLPAGTLIQNARYGTSDNDAALSPIARGAWGRWANLADLHTIVVPGATSSISIREPSPDPDESDASSPKRSLELLLRIDPSASNGPAFSPALALADFVAPTPRPNIPAPTASPTSVDAGARWRQKSSASTQPTVAPPAPQFEQELAILPSLIPADRAQVALIVPIKFSSGGAAVAIVISTSPVAADEAAKIALKQTARDLTRSAQDTASQPAYASAAPSNWPALASALDSLAVADRRRAAMVYLASQTGASLCQNVALVAESGQLEQLADAILGQTHAHTESHDSASLGWILESTTLKALLTLQQNNKLPPELAAALTDFAGQAGRDPSSMQEAMSGVNDLQNLSQRLAAENVIFLEDSSPASRVRAFDWLRARNLSPAGYDPLGPPRQRREALDRALSAAQGNQTQTP